MNWKYTIKLKHILESCDINNVDSICDTINTIQLEINNHDFMKGFQLALIPAGVNAEDANIFATSRLSKLYDYCDDNSIWVE